MFKIIKTEQSSSQEDVRNVIKKIQSDEEVMSKLFETLGRFQRRSSKMRDAYDHLSSCVHEIANGANSSKEQLLSLAINFAQIGDGEDDAVIELSDLISPFSLFKSQCQTLKSEISHIYDSSKEFNRLKIDRTLKWIRDRAEAFETKKLTELKSALSRFIKTELAFHVETVEIYSSAYKEILKINIENNTKELKDSALVELKKGSIGRDLATFLNSSPQLEERKKQNIETYETESSETERSESEEDPSTENSVGQLKA